MPRAERRFLGRRSFPQARNNSRRFTDVVYCGEDRPWVHRDEGEKGRRQETQGAKRRGRPRIDQLSTRRLRDPRNHRQGKESVACVGGARGGGEVHRGKVAAVREVVACGGSCRSEETLSHHGGGPFGGYTPGDGRP